MHQLISTVFRFVDDDGFDFGKTWINYERSRKKTLSGRNTTTVDFVIFQLLEWSNIFNKLRLPSLTHLMILISLLGLSSLLYDPSPLISNILPKMTPDICQNQRLY